MSLSTTTSPTPITLERKRGDQPAAKRTPRRQPRRPLTVFRSGGRLAAVPTVRQPA